MSQPCDMKYLRDRTKECGECWNWLMYCDKGRPRISLNNRHYWARRVAYELDRGPIQKSMRVINECGNLMCINPAHSRCVTRSTQGAVAVQIRGANLRTSTKRQLAELRRSRPTKLSMEIANEIRVSTLSIRQLAEHHGVARSFIGRVRNGTAYRDYSTPFAGLVR